MMGDSRCEAKASSGSRGVRRGGEAHSLGGMRPAASGSAAAPARRGPGRSAGAAAGGRAGPPGGRPGGRGWPGRGGGGGAGRGRGPGSPGGSRWGPGARPARGGARAVRDGHTTTLKGTSNTPEGSGMGGRKASGKPLRVLTGRTEKPKKMGMHSGASIQVDRKNTHTHHKKYVST